MIVPSWEMDSYASHMGLVNDLDGVVGTDAWVGDHPFS